MKHFLIISQVFPPDPAAVGQYFDEAAKALAERGHAVTVLTANRGYDNPDERFASKESRDGLQIRRLPFSSLGKANILIRIIAQLSFLLQCILRGVFSRQTTDLLISTSPPMAGIAAIVIGTLRPKLRIHYWLMDLNPDQAVALGAFAQGHPLVRAMDWLNRRILKRANNIIALDRFMAERLLLKVESGRGKAESGKISIIPPWPMDDYLEPVDPANNYFRQAQGWEDTIVVMYSGNHSIVHPLDTILDAAEALKDDPRFVFAFIGGGKGKKAVNDYIAKTAATASEPSTFRNIVSLPYQPLDQIRYSLSAADIHIVSLGNNMSGIVHPCKIYGALSIGRPILTLGPKESYLSDLLEQETGDRRQEAGSLLEEATLNPKPSTSNLPQSEALGWSIAHGDTAAAVSALQNFADKSESDRNEMGHKAKAVAEDRYSRDQLLKQFLDTIT